MRFKEWSRVGARGQLTVKPSTDIRLETKNAVIIYLLVKFGYLCYTFNI